MHQEIKNREWPYTYNGHVMILSNGIIPGRNSEVNE